MNSDEADEECLITSDWEGGTCDPKKPEQPCFGDALDTADKPCVDKADCEGKVLQRKPCTRKARIADVNTHWGGAADVSGVIGKILEVLTNPA